MGPDDYERRESSLDERRRHFEPLERRFIGTIRGSLLENSDH